METGNLPALALSLGKFCHPLLPTQPLVILFTHVVSSPRSRWLPKDWHGLAGMGRPEIQTSSGKVWHELEGLLDSSVCVHSGETKDGLLGLAA